MSFFLSHVQVYNDLKKKVCNDNSNKMKHGETVRGSVIATHKKKLVNRQTSTKKKNRNE